jgi:hypothetical protein
MTQSLQGQLLAQVLTQEIVDVRILGLRKNIKIAARTAMFSTGVNLDIGAICRAVVFSAHSIRDRKIQNTRPMKRTSSRKQIEGARSYYPHYLRLPDGGAICRPMPPHAPCNSSRLLCLLLDLETGAAGFAIHWLPSVRCCPCKRSDRRMTRKVLGHRSVFLLIKIDTYRIFFNQKRRASD